MLQSQLISLPFSKGIDTKSDPLLVAQPVELRNMVFRGGSLAKRYGFTQLSSSIDSGGSFSSGEALFSFKNELVRLNNGLLYRYSPAYSKWVTESDFGAARKFTVLTNTPIQRNTRTQVQWDQAVAGNYRVFAWVEPAGPQQGIHYSVMDAGTGTLLVTGEAALASTTTGTLPRLVTTGSGSKVLLLWRDGANLVRAVIDLANPGGGILGTNLATNLRVGFDAIGYGTGAVVAYVPTAGSNNTFTLIKLDAGGGSTLTTTTAALTTSSKAIGAWSLCTQTDGAIYIVYCDDGTGSNSYYVVANSSFTLTLGQTSVGPGVFTNVGLVESSANVVTAIYYGQTPSTGSMSYAVLTKTAVSKANTVITNSIGLALQSHPVLWEGSPTFAVAALPRGTATASVQPTGFVVQLVDVGTDTSILSAAAKVLPGLCSYTATARLPNPVSIGGNPAFLFAERGRLSYQVLQDLNQVVPALGGYSVNPTPVDVTTLGFTAVTMAKVSAAKIPVNVLGDAVYIAGAWPRLYDGRTLIDQGFHLCPEGLSVTFGAGGALSAGSYQWKAIYSWLDGQGQLVRSVASPAVTATATSTQKATVVVPTLPLSMRDGLPQGASVQVELYRTEANGTIFYRASSVTAPTYNSTGAATVSIDDGLADTALISSEILYSTGGVQDWLAPPAHSIAITHRDRLVIAGLEDPYEWRSSSQRVKGQQLRFNEIWGGRVPASTGKITGLASLDGALIIFTTGAAYLVTGDGPDLLGNNSWGLPQLITSVDAGAVTAQSVVTTPQGVFFQSPRGIKLLDRGLGCHYVGAPVEAFTGATGASIRCGTVRPEVEQIWFHLDTGSDTAVGTANALVYDWHYGQWSVMGSATDSYGCGAQSACYNGGLYTRVTSDGVCWQETPGYYMDNTTHGYTSVVETEWIHLAGLQGFQRAWRVGVLGSQGSSCTITMVCRSNYQGTVADETVTFNTATLAAAAPLQFQHHLSHQKSESVRFRISDGTPSGTGQGMLLTDLTLEVGIKKGKYKQPAATTI